MPVKYKPLYCCDGCGNEFEDSNKVRIFESVVKSGDETKIYIQTGMYCIECIPLALDFKNENPETVVNIDPKQALAAEDDLFEKQYEKILNKLAQDNYIHFGIQEENPIETLYKKIDKELQESFDNVDEKFKLINKDIKQLNNRSTELYNMIKDIDKKETRTSESMEDQILREEARNLSKKPVLTEEEFKKEFFKNQESLPANWPSPSELVGIEESHETEDINSLKHGDELTEKYVEHITSPKESQTTSQEPETTTENINSETEEDEFESIGADHGKYLILRLIDEEISERKFAQKNGYKDTKDLREACGLKSLIGLYYSTNKYTNTPTDFIVEPYEDQKIINKMFFGVPNIVKRNIFVARELNIALIEKDLFADKIESISFEVPEKLKDVEIVIPIEKDDLPANISKDKLKSFVNDAAKALNETKPNVYKEAETGFREMKEEAVRTGKPVITATQKKIFSKDKIGDDYI